MIQSYQDNVYKLAKKEMNEGDPRGRGKSESPLKPRDLKELKMELVDSQVLEEEEFML